jgi:hypothetical protein
VTFTVGHLRRQEQLFVQHSKRINGVFSIYFSIYIKYVIGAKLEMCDRRQTNIASGCGITIAIGMIMP